MKIVEENLQIGTLPFCTESSIIMKDLTSAKSKTVGRDSSKLLVLRYKMAAELLFIIHLK